MIKAETVIMCSQYNLKWNSHHGEMLSSFKVLRDRETLVDVVLSCGSRWLKAHKLVLCAGSGYFERMFDREVGGNNPVIYFFGVELHVVKFLVDFMYSGEVNVPLVDLEKFVELADALEVKGLKGRHPTRDYSPAAGATTELNSPVVEEREVVRKRKAAIWRKELPEDSCQPPEMKFRRGWFASGQKALIKSSQDLSFTDSISMAPVKEKGWSDVQDGSGLSRHQEEEVFVKEEFVSDRGFDDEGEEEEGSHESHYPEREEGSIFKYNEQVQNFQSGMNPPVLPGAPFGEFFAYVEGPYRTKVFQCKHCVYKTPHRGNANRHIRSHTGEKPYSCSVCGQLFSHHHHLKASAEERVGSAKDEFGFRQSGSFKVHRTPEH
ncbi:unnamed protein product [Darwinula stevensoni]|uniref:Uncharacterized protein n=1 Tax=Darwinula stevensoni TaxID=69355 RepID=A0A7R9ADY8_9CRUS|nr:unnamed protein product [Darwinula stevensoni]CAG0901819.1 unnamed protein product [Darwinula stevensoni]